MNGRTVCCLAAAEFRQYELTTAHPFFDLFSLTVASISIFLFPYTSFTSSIVLYSFLEIQG